MDNQTNNNPFNDKVVLITGAGGNFGRCGAHYFATRNAKLALCDAIAAPLDETVCQLTQTNQVSSHVCDITDARAVADMVDAVVAKFGRIDMLWNNAGVQGVMVPTLEYPIEDFQKVINVNVNGTFTVLQTVAKAMAKQPGGGGSIVNTASVAGMRGTPTMPAYVASKAAIIGLTISAAKDFAAHDIRVNAISPALIGPGVMWDRQNQLQAQSGSPFFNTDPEALAQQKVNSVPMKRLGTMEEVVKAVAFLLGPESSYSTGTNMVIAGGFA